MAWSRMEVQEQRVRFVAAALRHPQSHRALYQEGHARCGNWLTICCGAVGTLRLLKNRSKVTENGFFALEGEAETAKDHMPC